MAIEWGFYSNASGCFRWQVSGREGPIATGGKTFDELEACVADARARGYTGPDHPAVRAEPNLPSRESNPRKLTRVR